jgi:hypothetical protein
MIGKTIEPGYSRMVERFQPALPSRRSDKRSVTSGLCRIVRRTSRTDPEAACTFMPAGTFCARYLMFSIEPRADLSSEVLVRLVAHPDVVPVG